MKKLSRRQAWLKIQKAFRQRQVAETVGAAAVFTSSGMCWSVSYLLSNEEITRKVAMKMHSDIRSVKPAKCRSAWYWPTAAIFSDNYKAVRQGAKARVRAINKILKNI